MELRGSFRLLRCLHKLTSPDLFLTYFLFFDNGIYTASPSTLFATASIQPSLFYLTFFVFCSCCTYIHFFYPPTQSSLAKMKFSLAALTVAALGGSAYAAVVPKDARYAAVLPMESREIEARDTTVTGTPDGFAAGTTGGGDATPATPSSLEELKTWLTDDVARVIVIDRE